MKEKPFEERFFPSPPAPPPSFSKPFCVRFFFLCCAPKEKADKKLENQSMFSTRPLKNGKKNAAGVAFPLFLQYTLEKRSFRKDAMDLQWINAKEKIGNLDAYKYYGYPTN